MAFEEAAGMKNLFSPTSLAMVATGAWLCLAGAHAQAQSVRPGLWEHQFKLNSASGQLEQQMAQAQAELDKLPPDQRKMMEQMMGNMGLGLGSKPSSVRTCLTPEEAAKADVPVSDGDCRNTVLERSSKRVRIRFVCSGEDAAEGEAQVDFDNDSAYRTQADVRVKSDGKLQKLKMTGNSRWLGAACGAVKPVR
jgi:hypothetical protein